MLPNRPETDVADSPGHESDLEGAGDPRPPGAVRRPIATTLRRVTAKEKLLERAPHWTEEQAARALRAAEGNGNADDSVRSAAR